MLSHEIEMVLCGSFVFACEGAMNWKKDSGMDPKSGLYTEILITAGMVLLSKRIVLTF